MKKLFALAAIGLFTVSITAGAAFAGCGGHGVVAEGEMSTPVKIVLDSGAITPKPKTGS